MFSTLTCSERPRRAEERPEPYFIISGELDQKRPQAEMSGWGRTVSGCPKGRLIRGSPHLAAVHTEVPRGAPAHSCVPATLLCTRGTRQRRTPRDARWVTLALTVCASTAGGRHSAILGAPRSPSLPCAQVGRCGAPEMKDPRKRRHWGPLGRLGFSLGRLLLDSAPRINRRWQTLLPWDRFTVGALVEQQRADGHSGAFETVSSLHGRPHSLWDPKCPQRARKNPG